MPLEGIRVLDLTRLLPGPYCSLMLADFGADVIKIEDSQLGDYSRWNEPKVGEHSAMFHSLNRNKRSMSLDLKVEKNKKIFIDLVKTADVLVESFRPGVMDRLGIGYEELKKHNPKLIYCAITSYGQTGPYKDIPGHDINFLSYSGLLDLQGEQNRKPVSSSVQIGDLGGGALMGTIGILVSIIEAQKSGKGQFIDISMLDGAVSWMQTTLPAYLASNQLPKRGELVLNGGKACYEVYETKDQRYLSVGALEAKFWNNFCKVIGKEELIAKLEAPDDQQNAIKEEVQAAISTKTLNEWLSLFIGIDACVAPVLTVEEMVKDPQIINRRMIEDVYDPTVGIIRQIANPIKLSRTEAKTVRQAPGLGEHNEEILNELGYTLNHTE
jgi:crotonobetainyl-CoA:carnitine CoA-transferase CaiB-like acyl-CoA transferase